MKVFFINTSSSLKKKPSFKQGRFFCAKIKLKILKKIKKSVDKLKNMCYNVYIR